MVLKGSSLKELTAFTSLVLRTGLWAKHRINMEQEFVIRRLILPEPTESMRWWSASTREMNCATPPRVAAGFVPATRRAVFEKLKGLKDQKCPFINLPEKQAGRWGQGLTAEKMKECVWLRPDAVARIQFLEWTGAGPSAAYKVHCFAGR